MPELVKPSAKYRESFLAAMAELKTDGRHYDELNVTRENFAGYLTEMESRSQGINVPADRVPATKFWLVEDDRFIGRLDIRHELNDNLLKIGGHIGYFIRPSERRRGYGKK
ncbi:MAG: GNAT family acetyltransferase, partial [Patescibacteria group bacterium]